MSRFDLYEYREIHTIRIRAIKGFFHSLLHRFHKRKKKHQNKTAKHEEKIRKAYD